MEKEIQTTRVFSSYEWQEIGVKLENYHSIFSKFWDLGKPKFTNELPTAAVFFDKLGDCIDFNINPDFWDTLDEDQKIFVICHEVTHVLFYHGFRICGLDPQEFKVANLALDIVVNHFLVDSLGLVREKIDPTNEYCWVDTVFKDEKERPKVGECFEYYYNLIKKEIEKDPNSKMKNMSSMDGHEGLESFTNEVFEKMMKDAVNNTEQKAIDQTPVIKEMAKKELEAKDKAQKSNNAGINAGNSWIIAKTLKVMPKRKWETIIKRWSSKYLSEKVGDQWQKPNRRMTSMPKDFLLPNENETDEFDKKRIPVSFFLDTSGSCSHLAERFFKAAETLPEDRFILNLCCFDTQVYETTLKSKKLFGFGGTSFSCIETYLQKKKSENRGRYAEAVFVITDGYGDNVSPEFASRWQWFLSEDYRSCIPKESKTHMLSDFE